MYAERATTVDEWKAFLRGRLRAALGAKDAPAVAVLRETLAAIENAEAPPMRRAATTDGGVFAGSVGGLCAGEAERLVLTPEAVVTVVEREIHERREAASEYARLERHAEASALSLQVEILVALGSPRLR